MIIAIAQDDYTAPNKPDGYDASSGRWQTYLEAAGFTVKRVDVRQPDILSQLENCHAFMWRWAHFSGMSRIARRLLPVVEREMGIVTYPDQATCWHYDDKVAQAMLFEAKGIPSPKTWIFFDCEAALAWLKTQEFPLIMKLATGAGSSNVVLLKSREQAEQFTQRAFTYYLQSFQQHGPLTLRERASALLHQVLQGSPPVQRDSGYEPQAGYVLFQQFLPGNKYDTRVTVIGHRAFGFRRWNRPGDFRASGSGDIDYDPTGVDARFVRLAFSTAQKLSMQSCAIDGLWSGHVPVIGEVSYTYVSGAVYDCPGHWALEGDPETGSLHWVEGHAWPEQAQVEGFIRRLNARRAERQPSACAPTPATSSARTMR